MVIMPVDGRWMVNVRYRVLEAKFLERHPRLTKNFEYIKVYQAGRRWSSPFFTVYIKENGLDTTRLGVSVSKRIGNSVVRNRIKRRLKEVFKKNTKKIKKGFDVVISAKKPARDADFWVVEKEVINLLKRGHMLYD